MPLAGGRHADVVTYAVENGALVGNMNTGETVPLARPDAFAGYRGRASMPSALLLRHNNLHIEVVLDRTHRIGRFDASGVADILLESAVSTIMDLEDSVAAVDADDKVVVYRNWLGLMNGTLAAAFEKDGRTQERRLNPDRHYIAPGGGEVVVPGRSLMLVRNVGHHMDTDAVLDGEGREIPEGMLDAAVTALIAIHDLKGDSGFRNSRKGSAYIVKPKMHAPRRSPSRSNCSTGSRRCSAWSATRSRWASWTRSAAPRSTSPPASRRRPSGWCSSTPASSTAPATRSTPRWRPARSSARTT